ncbi:MAG: 16S rRNA (cytidine(1402)-2'-O)-methyltransferase [Acidobacteriota bacterium]
MSGALYVIATPVGNLEDLSPRALRLLGEVDLIACEDTRHTRKLLSRFAIQTPTTSYHEHNEVSKTPELIEKLARGSQIALVSDAGTPLLSDPGYHLIHGCREQGIPVYPVPGPTAATAALSVSGLPTDHFFFQGFLPRRVSARRQQLETIGRLKATLVIYLSPHSVLTTLKRIREVLGNRQAFLGREMTKLHETHYPGNLEQILKQLQQEKPRGEYTLVVEGQHSKTNQLGRSAKPDVLAYVAGLRALYGLSRKDAIQRASRELDLPKREVYRTVIEG